jgi:hypothetical protein
VLFERRLQEGLADGSIRLAFRRWRRAQAVGGRRYRSPIGLIEVGNVAVVDGDIPLRDAQAAGYALVEQLLADLRGPADSQIYRLELRISGETDPRDKLAHGGRMTADDLHELKSRLQRLDRSRPWTTATLRAIAEHPGRRAPELAALLGWADVLTFKLHVRKLKALGLTLSLRVGYQLAPRGEAFLQAISSTRALSVP